MEKQNVLLKKIQELITSKGNILRHIDTIKQSEQVEILFDRLEQFPFISKEDSLSLKETALNYYKKIICDIETEMKALMGEYIEEKSDAEKRK